MITPYQLNDDNKTALYRQKCKQLEALEKLIERDAPLYFALTDGGEIVAALEAVAGQLLDEIAELEQMGVTAGGQT